jgi:hypothetical protein
LRSTVRSPAGSGAIDRAQPAAASIVHADRPSDDAGAAAWEEGRLGRPFLVERRMMARESVPGSRP